MGRYFPLLRVDVGHAFFADARCRGLRFVPVGATPEWLHRHDAVVREDGSALALYCTGEALAGAAGTVLAWHVHCTDEHFLHCTEQPALWPRELLCFDTGDARQDGAGAWCLHAGESAAWTEVRPLTWPVVAQTLDGAARRMPPLALLRVPLAGLPPAPAHYRIRLAARATWWKYCLHGDWPEPQLQVIDLASQAAFGAPEPERLDGGAPMLAIRSQAPIALAQRSACCFQLRSRQRGGDKVLVKRLPVAAARWLSRERIDGASRLVSEIHVHR